MRIIVLKPFRDQATGKQRTKDEMIDLLDEAEAERLVTEGYAEKVDEGAPFDEREDEDEAS